MRLVLPVLLALGLIPPASGANLSPVPQKQVSPRVVYESLIPGIHNNGRVLGDVSITASGTTLTSATAAFTSADVGDSVVVVGAGLTPSGATIVPTALPLVATITAVSSTTSATVSVAATTTVTGAHAYVGKDDTAPLNAILAQGNVHIYLEGGTIVRGLKVPSGDNLDGMPGAFLANANGAGVATIQNLHPSVTAGVYGDSNITIQNLTIYGGRAWDAAGTTSGQIVAIPNVAYRLNPSGYLVAGVGMFGVQNLTERNIDVIDSPTFAFHQANCNHVVQDGLRQDVWLTTALNEDFDHFNGPCSWVYTTNSSGTSTDDFYALCADDGNEGTLVPSIGTYDPSLVNTANGPISHVFASGFQLESAAGFLRLLGGANTLSDVHVSGVHGTQNSYVANIDSQGGLGSSDCVGLLALSDIDCTSGLNGFGGINVNTAVVDDLEVTNYRSISPSNTQPIIQLTTASSHVRNLILRSPSIYETGSGTDKPYEQKMATGSLIDQESITGLNWYQSYSGTGYLIGGTGGTISYLTVSGESGVGRITPVSGPTVAATAGDFFNSVAPTTLFSDGSPMTASKYTFVTGAGAVSSSNLVMSTSTANLELLTSFTAGTASMTCTTDCMWCSRSDTACGNCYIFQWLDTGQVNLIRQTGTGNTTLSAMATGISPSGTATMTVKLSGGTMLCTFTKGGSTYTANVTDTAVTNTQLHIYTQNGGTYEPQNATVSSVLVTNP